MSENSPHGTVKSLTKRSNRGSFVKNDKSAKLISSQPTLNQPEDFNATQDYESWTRNKSVSTIEDGFANSAAAVSIREMSVGQNISGQRWSIEKLLMRSKSSYWQPVLGEAKIASLLERENLETTIESLRLSKDDAALAALLSGGFSSLWTHGIGKIYLLLYFIWLQKESHVFFWMEIIKYRQSYGSVYAFARKQQAQRIYSTFLAQSSSNFVHLGQKQDFSQKFLLYVLSHLDSPNRALFDDYAYLLMSRMEHMYKFGNDPDATAALKPTDAAFVKSAVFGLMRKDLSNCTSFSSAHVEKALDRLLEGCRAFSVNPRQVQDRIGPFLNSIGICIDLSHLNYKLVAQPVPSVSSASNFGASTAASSISTQSTAHDIQGNSGVSTDFISTSKPVSSQPPLNKRLSVVATSGNNLFASANMTSNIPSSAPNSSFEAGAKRMLDQHHTLLLCVDPHQSCCDFCFDPFVLKAGSARIADDNNLQPYRCESCGLVCHKQCRSLVGIGCLEDEGTRHKNFGSIISQKFDLEFPEDSQSCNETMEILEERLRGIQRQIEIEIKIQHGLAKFAKARKTLSTSEGLSGSVPVLAIASSKDTSTGSSTGNLSSLNSHSKDAAASSIDAQLQKSNQKLDILKRELHKCQMQKGLLQTMSLRLDFSRPDATQSENTEKIVLDSAAFALLSFVDPNSQTQLSSRFLITRDQLVTTLVKSALEKFHMSNENPENYNIWVSNTPAAPSSPQTGSTYDEPKKTPTLLADFNENTWSALRTDKPVLMQLAQTSEVILALCKKTTKGSGDEAPALEFSEKKVLAVIMETIETEIGYIEDMELLLSCFEAPMRESEYVVQTPAIFSNIDEICNCHSELFVPYLKTLSRELLTQSPIGRAKFEQSIEGFCAKLTQLASTGIPLYESYCSNLEFARLKLALMTNESPGFSKLLSSWETNPKLRKLHISDLLVKPMHRITRYPLLLKRLQGFFTAQDAEFKILAQTISKIESAVSCVNEAVREANGHLKLQQIEESLDFNGLFEKVRINNGKRVFISETPFSIRRRVGPAMACLALLFGDMLLIAAQKKEKLILLKPPIALENMLLLDDSSDKLCLVILVSNQSAPVILQARSQSDRASWMDETDAIQRSHVKVLYNLEMALAQDYVATHLDVLTQQTLAMHSLTSSNSMSKRPQTTTGAQLHRRSGTAPFQNFGLSLWLGLGASASAKQTTLKLSEDEVSRSGGDVANGSGSSLASESAHVNEYAKSLSKSGSVRRALSLVDIKFSRNKSIVAQPENIVDIEMTSSSAILGNDGDIESVISNSLSFCNTVGTAAAPALVKDYGQVSLEGNVSDSMICNMNKELPSLPESEVAYQDPFDNAIERKRPSIELSASAISSSTPPRQSTFDIDDLLVDYNSSQVKALSSLQDIRETRKSIRKRSSWLGDGALRNSPHSVHSTESLPGDTGKRTSPSSRMSLSRLSVMLRATASLPHASSTNAAATHSPKSVSESTTGSAVTPTPAPTSDDATLLSNGDRALENEGNYLSPGVQLRRSPQKRSNSSINLKGVREAHDEELPVPSALSVSIPQSDSAAEIAAQLSKVELKRQGVKDLESPTGANGKLGRGLRSWLAQVSGGANQSSNNIAAQKSNMSLDKSYTAMPNVDSSGKGAASNLRRKSLTAALSFNSLSTKSLQKIDPGFGSTIDEFDMPSISNPSNQD